MKRNPFSKCVNSVIAQIRYCIFHNFRCLKFRTKICNCMVGLYSSKYLKERRSVKWGNSRNILLLNQTFLLQVLIMEMCWDIQTVQYIVMHVCFRLWSWYFNFPFKRKPFDSSPNNVRQSDIGRFCILFPFPYNQISFLVLYFIKQQNNTVK
jgi:hypothetical protein